MKRRIGDFPTEEDASSHDLQNLLAPTTCNSISTNAEENGSEIKQEERDDKKEEQETTVVPFYKLFSFSDSTDIILMIVGTAGALANGATMPLLTVLAGSLINAFGEEPDMDQVVQRVSKKKYQEASQVANEALGSMRTIASFSAVIGFTVFPC